MKKSILIIFVFLISFCSFGQTIEETVGKFKLYKTSNIWTFLKLDTSSGEIWQIQFSVNENLQSEMPINIVKLAFGDDMQNGRFQIYNTKNHFNFLLLDSVDGSLWQFQWGLKEESRGLIYKY